MTDVKRNLEGEIEQLLGIFKGKSINMILDPFANLLDMVGPVGLEPTTKGL
ncbi:hypothetical protein MNBD_GAMMA26-2353 [hydrothermal vent metagenome]|uniref:Uncharacterized protein n=1 Tax=hydrothermal vent metagenome TaxID=652676 RepID=A0A3B1B7C4_9ZZZZ